MKAIGLTACALLLAGEAMGQKQMTVEEASAALLDSKLTVEQRTAGLEVLLLHPLKGNAEQRLALFADAKMPDEARILADIPTLLPDAPDLQGKVDGIANRILEKNGDGGELLQLRVLEWMENSIPGHRFVRDMGPSMSAQAMRIALESNDATVRKTAVNLTLSFPDWRDRDVAETIGEEFASEPMTFVQGLNRLIRRQVPQSCTF